MPLSAKLFLVLGSVNAALAVALGAFGAHGLKPRLAPDMLAVYQTAVQYHLYHALGLLAVGLIAGRLAETGLIRGAGWLMLAGMIVFCGSLYFLSISGQRWVGAVAPVGGMAFIVAWVLLAAGILRLA